MPRAKCPIINTEYVNQLLFEAHKKSMNSLEEVACIKEMAKVNGLYAPKRVSLDVEAKGLGQLQATSTAELIQMLAEDELLDHDDDTEVAEPQVVTVSVDELEESIVSED